MSLEAEMRQLLAEMSLLQYGKTQAFDASGGKSESPDPRPSGESHPMAEKWLNLWNGVLLGDLERAKEFRRGILEGARDELRAWKVRQAPADTNGSSEDDWVIEDGEGLTPDEAAMRFKRTPAMIRRLRLAKGRESERGLPYDRPEARVPGADERVANLYERGCTLNQIALQTGLHKTQVRRILLRLRSAA